MSKSSAQEQKSSFQFCLNWQVCIFTLLFFPLLIRLGFWQLERADEKRTIQQLVEKQQVLPPQPVEKLLRNIEAGETVLYRRAQATGSFDSTQYWLIENRSFRGRNGFHVVVPLHLSSGDTVLVNRGWVAGTGYREQLPKVVIPQSPVIVVGQLVKPSVNQLLAEEVKATGDWPRVILQLDIEGMSQELARPILPLIIQIDAENPSALQVHWANVNMTEIKHLGYAYQWFALAFALTILTILANTNLAQFLRKTKSEDYERK